MRLNINFRLLLFLVAGVIPVFANAQGFAWAQSFIATGAGNATAGACRTAFDADNNVYSLIGFKGTVDFDKSANVYNLTSTGNTDMVLLKEDAGGNFQWAKHFQCKSTNSFGAYVNQTRIVVDAAGYIYLAGHFRDTVDFDPGIGIFYIGTPQSLSYNNIFIVKLDSAGNFIWAKHIGGYIGGVATSSANLLDMKMNNQGICLLFNAWNNVDIDPADTSVVNLSGRILELLDTAGHYIWAKQIGDVSGLCQFAFDSFSNFYITGSFKGTVDFDPGSGVVNLTATPTTSWLSSDDSFDVFIQKLDSVGNFLWVKQIGGSLWDAAGDIAVDRWGNIAVTGHFSGTADFDPGIGMYNLTSNSTRSIFTLKLRSNGDFVWAQNAGYPTGLYEGRGITTDTAGNIYVVSYNYPTQKFDSSGNLLWTLATAGTNGWIALDNDNAIYLSGSFIGGNVDFDPGPGVYNLSAPSPGSGFILKLCQSAPPVLTASDYTSCSEDTVWLSIPAMAGDTVYYWQWNNTVFTGANPLPVTTSGTYSVTAYGGGCPAPSNSVTITVYPSLHPNIIISNSPGIMAVGQTVYLNATVNGAGSNYTIDWLRNGNVFTTTTGLYASYIKQAGTDTIMAILKVQGNPCADSAISPIRIVAQPDGISNVMAAQGVSIYPNPFEGFIKIDGLAKDDKISVADVTGRVLLSKEAAQQTEVIDTKGLAAGYYIIKLTAKAGSIKGNAPVVRR